jgi:hypothetical protein
MSPSHQLNERSPAKPAPPSQGNLILKQARWYGTTLRAIFRSNNSSNFWYAETSKPEDNSQPDRNPHTWDTPPRVINLSAVQPIYNRATMTSAKYAKKDGLYSKTMDYLRYRSELFGKPYWLKEVVTREIANCEILRRTPHPNIAKYRGVNYEAKTQAITALLFQRYAMTLGDLVYSSHTFDAEKCMQDVKKGIQHIHSLGYVHCDIKPENIFVDTKTRPHCFVVGDFDSMQEAGAQLKYKCGTDGWRPEDADDDNWTVDVSQDWFGLEMLRAWVREKGDGKPVQGRTYAKTSEILKRAKRKVDPKLRAERLAEQERKAEEKKRAERVKRIEALEKAEAVKKAEAAKKAEVAKKARAISKADASKKISAAKQVSPPKLTALPKPQQGAKRLLSPKRRPGAPKKLRIGLA